MHINGPGGDPERNIRSAEAKYTNSAIDEILGNVDDKKSAKARTSAAADEVDRAWGRDGTPRASKPGIFSKIGKAFSKFGQRVSKFFGGKQEAGFDPGAALERMTPTNTRDAVESKSDDESLENRYNVTYTRAQGRDAAQQLGEQKDSLDFGAARAKMGQASAQSQSIDAQSSGDVKRSLNVTMTRSEALEAAKKLTHAADDEKSHDIGKPGLGR